jgi:hypothetical protein
MNLSQKQRHRKKQKKRPPPLNYLKINTLHTKKCDVYAVLQSSLIVVFIHVLIASVMSSPTSMFCNLSFGCGPNTTCPSHGDLCPASSSINTKRIKIGLNAVARGYIIGC